MEHPSRRRTIDWVIIGLTGTAAVASAAAVGTFLPSEAGASETLSYRYDGRSRLNHACTARSGEGQLASYLFDRADNRTFRANERTDVVVPADSNLLSPNGGFALRMQSDGNLVVYQVLSSGWVPLWASNTVGTGATTAYFQSDGNLVLYTAQGVPVWSSNTYQYHCSVLSVQNDGDVRIVSPDGSVIWSTGTGGH